MFHKQEAQLSLTTRANRHAIFLRTARPVSTALTADNMRLHLHRIHQNCTVKCHVNVDRSQVMWHWSRGGGTNCTTCRLLQQRCCDLDLWILTFDLEIVSPTSQLY